MTNKEERHSGILDFVTYIVETGQLSGDDSRFLEGQCHDFIQEELGDETRSR